MKLNLLVLALVNIIFGLISLPLSLAETPTVENSNPLGGEITYPTPPDTSPPADNKTKPGGGLNGSSTVCHSENSELRALLPQKNPVFTISEQPSVLIYLTNGNDSISKIEFWFNSSQGKEYVSLSIPDQSGIILVKAPASIPIEQYTPWYFKITCKNESSVMVYGWFLRVDSKPEYQQQVNNGTPAIWYDVLAETAQGLQLDPNNEMLKKRWESLLKYINAQNLSNPLFVETEPISFSEE